MAGCTWPMRVKVGSYYHLNNEQPGLYVYIKIPITRENWVEARSVKTLTDFADWLGQQNGGYWSNFRVLDVVLELFAAFQTAQLHRIDTEPGQDTKTPLADHPEIFPHLHTRKGR